MTLFLISLAALAAGPALVPALTRVRWAARGLDAFILVSIGGLVFVHILPHSIEEAGLPALAALLVGLVLPFVAERIGDPERGAGSGMAAVLGLMALAVHALLDGMALAAPAAGADNGELLAATVLLHRMPGSMAIWWMVRPRYGTRGAVVALGVIALATALSFFGSAAWPQLFEGRWWYVLQALLVGALVHVVVHQSTGPAALDPHARWQPASALGGLAAVSVLALIPHLGLHTHHSTPGAFTSLALASAPPLLAAYLVATVLHAVRPRRLVDWAARGGRLSRVVRGTVLGVPLNICSCAVTPMFRFMTRRGVPPGAAIAFLVAAPEVSVASVLISMRLLGVQLGLIRLGLALVLGLLVGLLLGLSLSRSPGHGVELPMQDPDATGDLAGRLRQGLTTGFVELSDHTLPWLLVGLGIAALVEPLLDPGDLDVLSPTLQVPVLAALGMPVYVCATGSTPLMAVLVATGLSPGAAIAFLVTGQITNPATLGALSTLHGRAAAVKFAAGTAAIALAGGWLTNMVMGTSLQIPYAPASRGAMATVETVSLSVLAALVLASLMRQGVAGFVAQVLSLHGHGHHAHHHHDHR